MQLKPTSNITPKRGFAVFTEGCKIPDFDPFDPSLKHLIDLRKFTSYSRGCLGHAEEKSTILLICKTKSIMGHNYQKNDANIRKLLSLSISLYLVVCKCTNQYHISIKLVTIKFMKPFLEPLILLTLFQFSYTIASKLTFNHGHIHRQLLF